ncbi:hypothetical protein D3C75_1276430 [compost metagenome]
MPVSLTVMIQWSSVLRDTIRISPRSVKLMALVKRFKTIWRILVGSLLTVSGLSSRS